MVNRDDEVLAVATQAIEALQNVGKNFLRMHQENSVSDIPLIQNHWLPLPDSVASKGVLMSLIVPASTKPMISLVFIPAHGEVKPHWHKEETEIIRVVAGLVHFKLYASGEYNVVLSKGTLTEGMEVSIEPLRSHYIFTSDKDAYLKVKFVNP